MPIITVNWLASFESRMQRIVESEHLELVAGPNTWWDAVARVRPSASGREFISWFLNLATLEDPGQGGNNLRPPCSQSKRGWKARAPRRCSCSCHG